MSVDYFPLTIAQGDAFCNRKDERKLILNHIVKKQHLVLLAPRRYGKSSLIAQVASTWSTARTKRLHISSNMLSAFDTRSAVQIMMKAIEQGVNAVVPSLSLKSMQQMLKSFSKAGIKLNFTLDGFSFEIDPSPAQTKAEVLIISLADAFKKLDDLAREYQWDILIEIDEFQQISTLEHGYAIEAQLRDAVQYSRHTSYVFLGSSRQMIADMFTDASRPFYNSCHIMKIERIHASDYQKHLAKAARKTWTPPLGQESINRIILLTERHPYYLNLLCATLWNQDTPPDSMQVERTWLRIVADKIKDAQIEYLPLSVIQKAICNQLAIEPEKQITGTHFATTIRQPVSSIQKAVKTLDKKSIIFFDDEQGWKLVDPVLKTYLGTA